MTKDQHNTTLESTRPLTPCCSYWWYEVYTMVRRLLLTCAVLVMDSLASTVFFVVCVAIVTLVIEQECKAYENRFLSAFTAIWYGCGSVGSLSVRARLALDPSESYT